MARETIIIVIFGINNKRTYHFPALKEVTFVKRIYFLSIPNLSDSNVFKRILKDIFNQRAAKHPRVI